MDHRSLERRAQQAAHFLHEALVFHGKGTGRPCDGVNVAMADWTARIRTNPKAKPDSIIDQIAALAVEARDAARAAREVHDQAMAKAVDEIRVKREEAAAAEVERRRALRDERAEKDLWRGL